MENKLHIIFGTWPETQKYSQGISFSRDMQKVFKNITIPERIHVVTSKQKLGRQILDISTDHRLFVVILAFMEGTDEDSRINAADIVEWQRIRPDGKFVLLVPSKAKGTRYLTEMLESRIECLYYPDAKEQIVSIYSNPRSPERLAAYYGIDLKPSDIADAESNGEGFESSLDFDQQAEAPEYGRYGGKVYDASVGAVKAPVWGQNITQQAYRDTKNTSGEVLEPSDRGSSEPIADNLEEKNVEAIPDFDEDTDDFIQSSGDDSYLPDGDMEREMQPEPYRNAPVWGSTNVDDLDATKLGKDSAFKKATGKEESGSGRRSGATQKNSDSVKFSQNPQKEQGKSGVKSAHNRSFPPKGKESGYQFVYLPKTRRTAVMSLSEAAGSTFCAINLTRRLKKVNKREAVLVQPGGPSSRLAEDLHLQYIDGWENPFAVNYREGVVPEPIHMCGIGIYAWAGTEKDYMDDETMGTEQISNLTSKADIDYVIDFGTGYEKYIDYVKSCGNIVCVINDRERNDVEAVRNLKEMASSAGAELAFFINFAGEGEHHAHNMNLIGRNYIKVCMPIVEKGFIKNAPLPLCGDDTWETALLPRLAGYGKEPEIETADCLRVVFGAAGIIDMDCIVVACANALAREYSVAVIYGKSSQIERNREQKPAGSENCFTVDGVDYYGENDSLAKEYQIVISMIGRPSVSAAFGNADRGVLIVSNAPWHRWAVEAELSYAACLENEHPGSIQVVAVNGLHKAIKNPISVPMQVYSLTDNPDDVVTEFAYKAVGLPLKH